MKCQKRILDPEVEGDDEIQCLDGVEFSVKLGSVWGHYCGTHALEAVESEGETTIKPYDAEEAEEPKK